MTRRAYERYPVELEVKLRKLEETSTEIDATVISVKLVPLLRFQFFVKKLSALCGR